MAGYDLTETKKSWKDRLIDVLISDARPELCTYPRIEPVIRGYVEWLLSRPTDEPIVVVGIGNGWILSHVRREARKAGVWSKDRVLVGVDPMIEAKEVRGPSDVPVRVWMYSYGKSDGPVYFRAEFSDISEVVRAHPEWVGKKVHLGIEWAPPPGHTHGGSEASSEIDPDAPEVVPWDVEAIRTLKPLTVGVLFERVPKRDYSPVHPGGCSGSMPLHLLMDVLSPSDWESSLPSYLRERTPMELDVIRELVRRYKWETGVRQYTSEITQGEIAIGLALMMTMTPEQITKLPMPIQRKILKATFALGDGGGRSDRFVVLARRD